MACYILHKDLKMTLYDVRDHFNFFGKSITHCTVYHNVKLFAEVRKRKTHLEAIRDTIMQTVDPKFSLLKRIEEINDKGKIEQINNCISYYG
jgi:Fe2+ or Zn2+ uptake regulation protein